MYCSLHRSKRKLFQGKMQTFDEWHLTITPNGHAAKYCETLGSSKANFQKHTTNQPKAAFGIFSEISSGQSKLKENKGKKYLGDKCCLVEDIGIYKTINESIIKCQLLLIAGIERHPGPEFSKVICGTFNQGDNRFSNLAGKQCCAVPLYAFSTVKDVKYWTSDTVDSILEHGTALYERLGKDEFLVIEDLPDKVEIFNEQIDVNLKFNSNGILNGEKFNIDTMKDMISTKSKNTENELAPGFLLMLSEVTVSVIIRKRLQNLKSNLNLLFLILMEGMAMEEYVVVVCQC